MGCAVPTASAVPLGSAGTAVAAGTDGVQVPVQLVAAGAAPAPPLQETWLEPPETVGHGHPLTPLAQREACVWPLRPPQQPHGAAALARTASTATQRTQRTHRSASSMKRPARYDEEEVGDR